MDGENRRNEVVSLAVYPETKENWQDAAVQDLNADSLSQLVRVAVNRYIHEQNSDTSAEVSSEIHEQLTDLNSQQEILVQRLDEIKGQLNDVRETVVGTEVGPEIEALAEDLFDLLPTKQDLGTDPVLSGDFDTGTVPAPEPGTIEWLSDQLEASRYKIQIALDYLQQSTFSVKQTDDDIYYKEV